MSDLVKFLAPYGLVVIGLGGLYLNIDKTMCSAIVLCGVALINPGWHPPAA